MPSKTEIFNQSSINTFEARKEERESHHAEGSLRDELLSAPEVRGSYVFIPMGTVTVEGNSNTLTPESFVENSNNVAKLREKQNYLTGHIEGNATRLRGGKHMSGLNREFHNRQEKEPNGNNLTFLYDEKAKVDENEPHIPSVVLVHEKLSDEQVAQLRETLPADVPILDAKTNELLDNVGQEEREQRRERRLAEFDLGFVALAQVLQGGRYVTPDLSGFVKNSRSRVFRAAESGSVDEFFVGGNIRTMYGNLGDDVRPGFTANATSNNQTRQAAADGYDYGRRDDDSSQTTYDMPKTERSEEAPTKERVGEKPIGIPESEEVRAHREEQEAQARQEEELRSYAKNAANSLRERDEKMRETYKVVDDAAQEKFGKSVSELDDAEKKSLRRQAARDYHPDYAALKDTADRDKFEAFDQVLK